MKQTIESLTFAIDRLAKLAESRNSLPKRETPQVKCFRRYHDYCDKRGISINNPQSFKSFRHGNV